MAFSAIDVFSSKFALCYHVKVMEDVYRRATKTIAASYLQAYPHLPNEQLILIMKVITRRCVIRPTLISGSWQCSPINGTPT